MTGVQTCALPICVGQRFDQAGGDAVGGNDIEADARADDDSGSIRFCVTADGFEESRTLVQKGKDRNLEIFEDGESGKDVHDLKGATDSLLYPLMDREAGNLLLAEKDFPGIGKDISGKEIDERCLSCPVWTDDGGEDSFLKSEVNAIRGADDTKILSELFRSEEIGHLTTTPSKFA